MLPDRAQMLEAENDALRERIRQLEAALTGDVPLPVEFGLTGMEQCVLGILLNNGFASRSNIMTAIYGARPGDGPEIKIVDVLVCKARKKLKAFGVEIQTRFGQGYYLDERTRAELKAYIAQAGVQP